METLEELSLRPSITYQEGAQYAFDAVCSRFPDIRIDQHRFFQNISVRTNSMIGEVGCGIQDAVGFLFQDYPREDILAAIATSWSPYEQEGKGSSFSIIDVELFPEEWLEQNGCLVLPQVILNAEGELVNAIPTLQEYGIHRTFLYGAFDESEEPELSNCYVVVQPNTWDIQKEAQEDGTLEEKIWINGTPVLAAIYPPAKKNIPPHLTPIRLIPSEVDQTQKVQREGKNPLRFLPLGIAGAFALGVIGWLSLDIKPTATPTEPLPTPTHPPTTIPVEIFPTALPAPTVTLPETIPLSPSPLSGSCRTLTSATDNNSIGDAMQFLNPGETWENYKDQPITVTDPTGTVVFEGTVDEAANDVTDDFNDKNVSVGATVCETQ